MGRGSALDEWIETPSDRLAALAPASSENPSSDYNESICQSCKRTFTSKHALNIHIGLSTRCKATPHPLQNLQASHDNEQLVRGVGPAGGRIGGGKRSIDERNKRFEPFVSARSTGSDLGRALSLHERDSKRAKDISRAADG